MRALHALFLAPLATTDDWGYARSVEILYHERRLEIFPVVAAAALTAMTWVADEAGSRAGGQAMLPERGDEPGANGAGVRHRLGRREGLGADDREGLGRIEVRRGRAQRAHHEK